MLCKKVQARSFQTRSRNSLYFLLYVVDTVLNEEALSDPASEESRTIFSITKSDSLTKLTQGCSFQC
jgi:hypothetical protein